MMLKGSLVSKVVNGVHNCSIGHQYRAKAFLSHHSFTGTTASRFTESSELRYISDAITETEALELEAFLKPTMARKRYEGKNNLFCVKHCQFTRLLTRFHPLISILNVARRVGQHWDDVIQHYKELELVNYRGSEAVARILRGVENRIASMLQKEIKFLPPHVIDLAAEGYIGMWGLLLQLKIRLIIFVLNINVFFVNRSSRG
jgi:hypothetical protein